MKHANCKLINLFVLLSAFTAYGSAQAFNPQPEPPATPPVGMTINETAVIHASLAPDPYAPAALVQVQLGLFDASGELRIQLRVDLTPGKIVSMDISGEKLAIPAGVRMSTLR